MKLAKSIVAAMLLVFCPTNAFVFHKNEKTVSLLVERHAATRTTTAIQVTPQDLTEMMAKAHEEKIRAMKDIEEKKNAEIQVRFSMVEFV
jgi:hypothetical protein